MPSSLPCGPNFSFVVALIPIKFWFICKVSEIFFFINSTYGLILGLSATITLSKLFIAQPAFFIKLFTSDNNNVASRALNTVTLPLMTFGANATDASKRSLVSNSLEILNDLPITGDISTPTLSELKQRATDVFASQNRAVTAEDYEAIIYRMPSKFGKIKRARILRDQDSFKRNLNLYLLTENADGHLAFLNGILKNNVKTWINSYKMVNDTIDILDPKIVNIGIRFTAIVNYDQDKFEALNSAISTISTSTPSCPL